MKNDHTNTTTQANMIITEANDMILVTLTSRNQMKPASVQGRILRRIIEKRQAQANHRRSKAFNFVS